MITRKNRKANSTVSTLASEFLSNFSVNTGIFWWIPEGHLLRVKEIWKIIWSPAPKLQTSNNCSHTERASTESCCWPSPFLGSPFTSPPGGVDQSPRNLTFLSECSALILCHWRSDVWATNCLKWNNNRLQCKNIKAPKGAMKWSQRNSQVYNIHLAKAVLDLIV